ncbi:hypothetical protein [Bartonella tribocorum]|nr:hypothetical protein [Bartonella tribocorum]
MKTREKYAPKMKEENETSMTIQETQSLCEILQKPDHKLSGVSSASDKESNVLAFKEAMALSSKDYKIIFCIFIYKYDFRLCYPNVG